MRIEDINDKIKERPNSTKSGNNIINTLPPVKTNRNKGLNVTDGIKIPTLKGEENKLNNSLTDDFFKTQIK